MNKINKLLNLIVHKPRVLGVIGLQKISFLVPDKPYLQMMYWLNIGKKLNLKHPVTFNEKLQWLKLYNRKPEYTIMVDKVKAKEYVAKIIGEEHIIPTLGVWDDPDDIDFDALPDKFVLKCNHNSGTGMYICKDKRKLDVPKVKAELRKGLKENYFLHWREWPYKNVPRKILAEKFMEDGESTDLKDYKLMCFNGNVFCTFVCSDRFSQDGLHITFFDKEWKRLPFVRHYPASKSLIPKPKAYSEMVALTEKLSKNIPFVRTDFYEINGQLYFGELTFFPGSGLEEFSPEEWDEKLGNLIVLPPLIKDS